MKTYLHIYVTYFLIDVDDTPFFRECLGTKCVREYSDAQHASTFFVDYAEDINNGNIFNISLEVEQDSFHSSTFTEGQRCEYLE